MKWVYAAYRKGAFGDALPADLNAEGFSLAFRDIVARVHEVFMLYGPTIRPDAPVGLMTVQPGFMPDQMVPHALWFPWASARNKVECMAWFFSRMVDWKAIVIAETKDVPFFNVIRAYGYLRRVGTSVGWFGEDDAAIFETRKR